MSLTPADEAAILKDGYLHKPGLVPRDVAERARRAINADLGRNGIDPSRVVEFRTQSFCPDLRDQPPVTDLINHPAVEEVIDALIAVERKPAWGGQIALRFPQPIDEARDAKTRGDWGGRWSYHIDGTPPRPNAPDNGVPPGEVHNFALLVGVLLNDQPSPWRGNFTVWPGSHLEMADHFRRNGVERLAETGTPPVATAGGRQVTGGVGDVVFAHHLTAHGIAPNLSADVRYNCFFRVWPAGRGKYNPAALTDPWAEWKIGESSGGS